MGHWTTEESIKLYSVTNWSSDFFSVNAQGNAVVQPKGAQGPKIDLLELLKDLQHRGLRTPLLIRFPDILASRLHTLNAAFQRAIREYDYRGRYRGVYPIKVNQQRHIVKEMVEHGAPFALGLEAGSKPELLISLALLETPNALIICNGYKDRAYLETALLAQRLGRYPVIVIDRQNELDLLIKTARELNIRPHIGIRARLSTKGAGKWVESTGERSKFGLSASEIMAAVDRLRAEDMLDCLELLHFHIGSQITAIRAHKDALREATRVFVELCQMGANLKILDVGGGLGIDYDGSKTNFHSSKNYSVQEYANSVIGAVFEACDANDVPHPDIVTESGRSLVAHHSVLIFDVLGVNEILTGKTPDPITEDDHRVLQELVEVSATVTHKNLSESYHNSLQLKEEAITLFTLGHMSLSDRARTESWFHHCAEKILNLLRELDEIPEEFESLEKELADTYFGNFSVFQSAPDHWAVKQLFPVMPIHRLQEEPTRRGVFADLTCDSDGKIDRFIDQREIKKVLELHPWNDKPYYIGIFLVGAYQEILGDLHNLFGDTDAVHVNVDDDGLYSVEHVVEGDSVDEVLSYVQYDRSLLIETVRRTIEKAMRAGDIGLEDSARLRRHYEQGLQEYTYLSREP